MKVSGSLSFRLISMVGDINEIQGHWCLGHSILAVLEIRELLEFCPKAQIFMNAFLGVALKWTGVYEATGV